MGSASQKTAVWRGYLTAQSLVFAAPLVFLGVIAWAHRWMFDDAFIYLRIVRNVRLGHGPVFNTGQRVEAYSGPLWVAVLAVADLVTPVRLEWLSVVLGIGFSVVGAGLAMAAATRLVRRDGGHEFLFPVGIGVFAALLPVWYFETSGLETGLAFAWLGLCAWVLATWAVTPDGRLPVYAAIVIGLGWLVRPELVLDSAVFLAVVSVMQWRHAGWRRRISLVVWTMLLPAAYQLFRMAYFGSIVANTAIAKEGSRLRVGTGMGYLFDFARPYWLWIPVALLLVGCYLPLVVRLRRSGDTRSISVLAAFVVAAGLNAFAVIAFGGDYVHARLLLPALFALCAPVAVMPVAARYVASLAIIAWAFVCATALRPPETRASNGVASTDGIAYLLPPNVAGHVTLSQVGWGEHAPRRRRVQIGSLFVLNTVYGSHITRATTPLAPGVHNPTFVAGGIGAIGYALGPRFSIIDLHGLGDPLAAHLQLARRGWPGHEKTLPAAWVAALVTATNSNPRLRDFPIRRSLSTPPGNESFDEQVRWARSALQCSAISDLERSVEGALTPRRMLSNIVHSFGRTERRIPSNPETAYHRYCSN